MFCKILIILNIVSVFECMDHQYFVNGPKNQMDTEQEGIVKRDIERQDRIYGGENCPAEEFKTIVSIRKGTPNYDNHECGATLINKNWILTAAHCHMDKFVPYYAVAGIATSDNAKPVISEVSKWYHPVNPDYGKNTDHDYDIALVLLETPMEETEFIKYVKLPTQDLGDIRQFCPEGLIKGWGKIERWNEPKTERDLQCFYTSINSDDCLLGTGNKDMLVCLIDPNRKGGSCTGDSGGPLMCNGIQIGTSSFTVNTVMGGACNSSSPQGYVRVDKHLGFINRVMESQTPRKGNSPNMNCMSISMWLLVFFNVFRQFLYMM